MTHALGNDKKEVYMEESILNSIKKLLGPSASDEHFDQDIIMNINASISILTQIGLGPSEGFVIEDDSAIWSDLIGEAKNLELVKTYVYLKAKMVFDPPSSGTITESYNKIISEYESRISYIVDKS